MAMMLMVRMMVMAMITVVVWGHNVRLQHGCGHNDEKNEDMEDEERGR